MSRKYSEETLSIARLTGMSPEAVDKLNATQREFWQSYARNAAMPVRPGAVPLTNSVAVPALRAERLKILCSMYGANTLVPTFEANAVPLAAVARMLEDATGGAPKINAAGIERVKLQIGIARLKTEEAAS